MTSGTDRSAIDLLTDEAVRWMAEDEHARRDPAGELWAFGLATFIDGVPITPRGYDVSEEFDAGLVVATDGGTEQTESEEWAGSPSLRCHAEVDRQLYEQYGRPSSPYYLKCLHCGHCEELGSLYEADANARRYAGVHGGLDEVEAQIVVTDSCGRELFRHHSMHTPAHQPEACPQCETPRDDDRVACPDCGHIPEDDRLEPDDGLRADGGARFAYSMMTDNWYRVTEYEDLGDGQIKAKSKEKVDREEVPQDVLDATTERGDRDE